MTFTVTDAQLTELFTFSLHRTEAKIFANRLLELIAAEKDSENGINGVSLGPSPLLSEQVTEPKKI